MPARVSDWFRIVKDKEVKIVAGKKGLPIRFPALI